MLGKIESLQPAQPPVRVQPRPRAKTRLSSGPSTKFGTEMARVEMAIVAWSQKVRGRMAARMPRGMPTISAKAMACRPVMSE